MVRPITTVEAIRAHARRVFLLYLEHSYRYYELDDPIVSDGAYESICRELYDLYPRLLNSQRIMRIVKQTGMNQDDLLAGTGYHLRYTDPEVAKLVESTMRWRDQNKYQIEGY